jgi:hypothetical protein
MKIKVITLVGALVNCSRYYGRKRARCCSLDTGWLLILVLYPGCTAIENNRPIKLPSNVQASQAQKDDKTQWASNAQGTLFGENMDDFIILQWSLNDSATEYFVYRSTSPNGPWEQTGMFSPGAARTGGAKIDDTPRREINGPLLQGRGHRCQRTCN